MIEWDRARAIASELSSAQLPDPRLGRRLESLAGALAARPAVGIPQAVDDDAALEGAYRFLKNPRVDSQAILASHASNTVSRAGAGPCLVIHDTTEFRFGGESPRPGLGPLKGSGAQGFFAHVSLAVQDPGTRNPLGVVALETWARPSVPKRSGRQDPKKRILDPDRESLRWHRAVEKVEDTFDGKEIVHLMDREGDAYELLASLISGKQRFVIRSSHNRLLADSESKLLDSLDTTPFVFERGVPLSRRGRKRTPSARRIHPPRNERDASLSISAQTVRLRRPSHFPASMESELEVNVIAVRELEPPEGEPPVSWTLLTSEPISTAEELGWVVDAYRARWVIEELFKAIKTGCAFEKRQLESFDALVRTLTITLPIAWQLLRIRHWAKLRPDKPAATILSELQLRILAALLKTQKNRQLPKAPTVEDAMLAIAALGGHLRRNGPPGWQTLGRGYEDLAAAERGIKALADM